jgi:hypothetical protein
MLTGTGTAFLGASLTFAIKPRSILAEPKVRPAIRAPRLRWHALSLDQKNVAHQPEHQCRREARRPPNATLPFMGTVTAAGVAPKNCPRPRFLLSREAAAYILMGPLIFLARRSASRRSSLPQLLEA